MWLWEQAANDAPHAETRETLLEAVRALEPRGRGASRAAPGAPMPQGGASWPVMTRPALRVSHVHVQQQHVHVHVRHVKSKRAGSEIPRYVAMCSDMWRCVVMFGDTLRYVAMCRDVRRCIAILGAACGAGTVIENGDMAISGDTWRYLAICSDITRCVSLICLRRP